LAGDIRQDEIVRLALRDEDRDMRWQCGRRIFMQERRPGLFRSEVLIAYKSLGERLRSPTPFEDVEDRLDAFAGKPVNNRDRRWIKHFLGRSVENALPRPERHRREIAAAASIEVGFHEGCKLGRGRRGGDSNEPKLRRIALSEQAREQRRLAALRMSPN